MDHEGLIKILNVLPDSTSAIGFVECGITDIGGQKIIDWAYKNKGIKQIYLELVVIIVNQSRIIS